jgi:hypothetical protein
MILTVDLASKFSAVCVQDKDGKVRQEFDSRNQSAFAFTARIRTAADFWQPDRVVIEDVPHGINRLFMVKSVLRLQGVLMRDLAEVNMLDRTWFLNPSTWMSTFGIKTRGQTDDQRSEILRNAAAELGYTAPDLVKQYVEGLPLNAKVLKKNTKPLEKSMTDYVAAYLMGHWVRQQADITVLPGVQPPSI